MRPNFIPFLFDNREAWEKTLVDSRYYYDMPFQDFMVIYQEYRKHIKFGIKPIPNVVKVEVHPVKQSDVKGEILDQLEIDQLIQKMISKESPKPIEVIESPKPIEPVIDGMLCQSDIDDLFSQMQIRA